MNEIWKKIIGWDNYSVSNFGNIRNDVTGKVLNPFDRKKGVKGEGYLSVRLPWLKDRPKNCAVHSIVLAAFVGPRPDGMVINHKDNNPSNNRLDNLHYCTQGYNIHYAFKQGRRSLAGEKNNSSKLKEQDVINIRRLRKEGKSLKEIAAIYSVGGSVISHICTLKYWKHVLQPTG